MRGVERRGGGGRKGGRGATFESDGGGDQRQPARDAGDRRDGLRRVAQEEMEASPGGEPGSRDREQAPARRYAGRGFSSASSCSNLRVRFRFFDVKMSRRKPP